MSQLKVKGFPSKYPYKQEARGDKEITFEGTIQDFREKISLSKEHDVTSLKPNDKFVIIYKNKDYAKEKN